MLLERGECFTFQGVRPGRYLLGRRSYDLNGVLIPAVYYPGTANRDEALVASERIDR